MTSSLSVYLQDHLAGATFAIHLLDDLLKSNEVNAATLARDLLPKIEADKTTLEDFMKNQHIETDLLKKASAWIAERTSRLKLSLEDPIGIYEAIEMLCLGVLGKRCLWSALQRNADGGAFPAWHPPDCAMPLLLTNASASKSG